MKPRKTLHADLENKRSWFFELGLVFSLTVVLFLMELKFKERSQNVSAAKQVFVNEQEMVPITRQEQVVPPPPPKPLLVYDLINIVDNDVELLEELEILDSDTDQDQIIEIVESEQFEMEEEVSEALIFIVVEEMPIFRPQICKTTQEGNIELMKYISQSIRYPIPAAENGLQGRVYVSFVVSPTGKVTDVAISRGCYPDLDNEAVRVVSNLPNFSPGRQRGVAVRVKYSVPINFILQ